MAKLRVKPQSAFGPGGVACRFFCPGCGHSHIYDVRFDGQHPSWQFNGNLERPTFTPSMKVTSAFPHDSPRAGQPFICHLYLTNGRIQYLADCSHSLAGKTVDLPDLE